MVIEIVGSRDPAPERGFEPRAGSRCDQRTGRSTVNSSRNPISALITSRL